MTEKVWAPCFKVTRICWMFKNKLLVRWKFHCEGISLAARSHLCWGWSYGDPNRNCHVFLKDTNSPFLSCCHHLLKRAFSAPAAALYINTLILPRMASGQLCLPLNSYNPCPSRVPFHRKVPYTCLITLDFFFLLFFWACLKGSPSEAKGTINFRSLLWGIWKLKRSPLDYSC